MGVEWTLLPKEVIMFSMPYFPLLQPHQIKTEDTDMLRRSPPTSVLSSSFSSLASPPRTPTDVLEASEILRPTISSSSSTKNLSFSIDNILKSSSKPSAPSPPRQTVPTAKPAQSKPKPAPKIDVEVPVDLSKTTNEAPKADADCPPGMVRGPNGQLWPAWVFCTRYSDRPSSGPRARKMKKSEGSSPSAASRTSSSDDKRPRTAFTSDQLKRLRHEFTANRY